MNKIAHITTFCLCIALLAAKRQSEQFSFGLGSAEGVAMTGKTYLTVRYAETDMMGIVHHSRYYPWFEVARTEFIKSCGMKYSEMEKQGMLLPLTQTGAKYLHGLRYEDEVLIECRVSKLSVARCEFEYKVYKLPEMLLCTEGMTAHGFTDAQFRPINLKKKFPQIWDIMQKALEEKE